MNHRPFIAHRGHTILIGFALMLCCASVGLSDEGALAGARHRVVVSTDIGGTDPDDFQSMVHLLVYADVLDLEGLISSPYGPGRKEHILKVIDCYESDYRNLRTYSAHYPTAEALRAITKQGETEVAPFAGVRSATDGSDWIVACARRDDPRPLYLLVWGGLEDLAQALHDAPDILPKLRVYWIGGPNKKWSPDAFQYLVDHHPNLWMIEANSTYRGWFVGGDQANGWGNREFVAAHVAGQGKLGEFFARHLDGNMKMGDTPSVTWLLQGSPTDPTQASWGGQFVRATSRPYVRFEQMPEKTEAVEQFGVVEIHLTAKQPLPIDAHAELIVENQSTVGTRTSASTLSFRFAPKDQKTYTFMVRSNVPEFDGKQGGITSVAPQDLSLRPPRENLVNWWTDSREPQWIEGVHYGAKSVSRWRHAFLSDFAQRMQRCATPSTVNENSN